MKLHFTKHAKDKLELINKAGFSVNPKLIKDTILTPIKTEDRLDGTKIVTSLLDLKHVLRVVYRIERDIIVVITCYPGRRKAYEV